VPALEFIKKHFPEKRFRVYFPPKRFSKDIFDTIGGKNVRKLEKSKSKFYSAILPHEVVIKEKQFFIPLKWENY